MLNLFNFVLALVLQLHYEYRIAIRGTTIQNTVGSRINTAQWIALYFAKLLALVDNKRGVGGEGRLEGGG